MNILFLSWRDPKNPKSGGAERLNLHIALQLLSRHHQVTWYSLACPSLPPQEDYQGIRLIRFGNLFTHFLYWPFFLLFHRFGQVDLIIDCVHGTGYLSNFIAPHIPRRVLVCEVAQNIWTEMWPFPINLLGQLWEHISFRLYRRSPFWAISPSTKTDLIKYGVPSQNISILPMGYDAAPLPHHPAKFSVPTALFVGRLCVMKGIYQAILSLRKVPKWHLYIIGRGEAKYEHFLKQQINKYKLTSRVHFVGFVSETEKFKLMARSWVLLVPSSREGWGMIVPEANSVGTPAVGYSVAGLRDVLPYYSAANILIPPQTDFLSQTLLSITSAPSAVVRFPPGWQALSDFIDDQIPHTSRKY